jgi:deazaflavin-dependent oxidoreductase (nitroreductase family)
VNRVVIWLYRLLDGRLLGRTLLLLTTRGRRSGMERTTALHYQLQAGVPVVCASNAGRARAPAWLLNIRSEPRVIVRRGRRRYECLARELPEGELWEAWVARDPGYARMAGPGKRYPLVALTPAE